MQESIVFCSSCMMSSLRKFTFATSSPDEFLVSIGLVEAVWLIAPVCSHLYITVIICVFLYIL